MFEIQKPNSLPIKIWLKSLDLLEPECLQQIYNIAQFPFAFHHIAIMPDAHTGYGMPIGGVLATKDVVIPHAVGVDIGCGMCTVKTSLTEIDRYTLEDILQKIRNKIPIGFKHHKLNQSEKFMPQKPSISGQSIVREEYQSALSQIGTLGGGNHFIEIQKGNDGHIWIMVHSGSRNIGYKVANHYNKLAKKINEKYNEKVSIPRAWDLAYLFVESKEGQDYLKEMNFCIDFAFASRKLMMDVTKSIFKNFPPSITFDEMINIAHNYASEEKHFGQTVWVHRKGATQAQKGQIGIIPGSQGTSSFIVIGKGSPDSFSSCSHGAGRVMSRHRAIKELNLQYEITKMEQKGILHSIRRRKDLDEASSAYKNIDVVIANQKDLIDILVQLNPLAVVKG
ncbi:RtcB family protein [bacterium]